MKTKQEIKVPAWRVKVSAHFTRLTCPRPDCNRSFFVNTATWSKRRSGRYVHVAPCPFCFRTNRVPGS